MHRERERVQEKTLLDWTGFLLLLFVKIKYVTVQKCGRCQIRRQKLIRIRADKSCVEVLVWQVQLLIEIRGKKVQALCVSASTAPEEITNLDLSNAQHSGEGYVSLTIQTLARKAQVTSEAAS